ncbi:MAG: polymer-forming cytoskeletal protein [Alphaproteobacteria bacterium]
MFRRKEDSLFDNTTDPNQEREETASATSTSATSSQATQGSSYAGTSSVSPATPSSAYGQSMPRPPGATQPTSSAFRPGANTSIPSDMGRNRMPEVGKPQAPAMPSSSGPIPAPSSATESKSSFKAGATGNTSRRVLTVGNDILLKGEIATCDRLVIEGKVDATLNDVHTVEIAEHGSFKGSANIEDAEISGLFEGDLIVRNRLVIYSTGKVRGTITYGEIEIERGGELTGEIKSNASGASGNGSRTRTKSKEAA